MTGNTGRRTADSEAPGDFSQQLAECSDSAEEPAPGAAPKKAAEQAQQTDSQSLGTGRSARRQKPEAAEPAEAGKRRRPHGEASVPVLIEAATLQKEPAQAKPAQAKQDTGQVLGKAIEEAGAAQSEEEASAADKDVDVPAAIRLPGEQREAPKAVADIPTAGPDPKPPAPGPAPETTPEIAAASGQVPDAPHTAAADAPPLAFAARLSPDKPPAEEKPAEAPASGQPVRPPEREAGATAKSAAAAPAAAKARPQPAAEERESSESHTGDRQAGENPAKTAGELPREHAATVGPEPRTLFQAAAPTRESEAARPATEKTEVRAVEAADPVAAADPAPRSEAVRDLSLRIGDNGRERVEVRLTEQAGEVKVAVHASDADLRRGLRDSLSDLVGRLEGSGYQTEAWRPREVGFDRQDSSNRQPQQEGGGGFGQGQNRERHSDSRQQQPKWVEEMEQRFRQSGTSAERTTSWLQQSIR